MSMTGEHVAASRTSPPGSYAVVTVASALWGLVLTGVAIAVLSSLARRSTPPSGTFDLSEVFEIMAWWVLVLGALLVPLAIAARVGSDVARVLASVVLAILGVGAGVVAAALHPLFLVPACSLAAIVVLLGRSAQEFCSDVRNARPVGPVRHSGGGG